MGSLSTVGILDRGLIARFTDLPLIKKETTSNSCRGSRYLLKVKLTELVNMTK